MYFLIADFAANEVSYHIAKGGHFYLRFGDSISKGLKGSRDKSLICWVHADSDISLCAFPSSIPQVGGPDRQLEKSGVFAKSPSTTTNALEADGHFWRQTKSGRAWQIVSQIAIQTSPPLR